MKYSILVPAFKVRYLSECLTSILAQSYEDFEVIVVDDASPENIFETVSQFKDERIRYYRNSQNCGAINVVDNWNICLKYAKGDYLICLGDDDKLLPWCLEEYNKLIEKYPDLDVYHARTELIDENSSFCGLQEHRPEYETVFSMIWHNMEKCRNQYIGDFLFKRVALLFNGGFFKLPLAWGADFISSEIAASTKGIANTQRICFQYRVSRITISRSSNTQLQMKALSLMKEWHSAFINNANPQSDLDKKYVTLIKQTIPEYYKRRFFYTISRDMTHKSIKNLIFWIRNRKIYDLSLSFVFVSFFNALRMIVKK